MCLRLRISHVSTMPRRPAKARSPRDRHPISLDLRDHIRWAVLILSGLSGVGDEAGVGEAVMLRLNRLWRRLRASRWNDPIISLTMIMTKTDKFNRSMLGKRQRLE
jgi:hypothetical protein